MFLPTIHLLTVCAVDSKALHLRMRVQKYLGLSRWNLCFQDDMSHGQCISALPEVSRSYPSSIQISFPLSCSWYSLALLSQPSPPSLHITEALKRREVKMLTRSCKYHSP